jgi:hypothetical protein
VHAERGLRLAALKDAGADQVWHTFAVWGALAFDASGWHRLEDMVAVNEEFEGRRLEVVDLDPDLGAFCVAHHHRPPGAYWRDPLPRAEAYVRRFMPPWSVAEDSGHDLGKLSS